MARRPKAAAPPSEPDTIFDVEDAGNLPPPEKDTEPEQPMYEIYEDSRIPVSRAVGAMWRSKWENALGARTMVHEAWDEAYRYYNHNQSKDEVSTRGTFRRGDGTENVVWSNVNTIVPAIASKNPDISCTALDPADEPFCKASQKLVNSLFKKKNGINLKPRAKRASMLAELTNFGVLKLEFTQKGESREAALDEMAELKAQFAKAKDKQEVQELYGKLAALESQLETSQQKGFKISVMLPHNLVVDPVCDNDDLSDADWVAEACFLSTAMLNARYTRQGKGDESDSKTLIYKPTHKASFDGEKGALDEGLGIVMEAITGDTQLPTSWTEEERLSYLGMYYTECVYIWDKIAKRVFLFDKHDWTWPVWVWDDPYHLSRFFPYFVIQFAMATSGIVSPGPTSYYLDQQDEINDINRQVSLLRRRHFDFAFVNTNVVDADEAEKFLSALRGETQTEKSLIHVKLDPSQKFEDVIGSIGMPSKEAQPLFDKGQAMAAIDRISSTSDALRGTEFKANTTEDAVQAYVDAVRLRIGAKIDAIEDTLADLAYSVLEIAIQFMDKDDVASVIGEKAAEGWQNMPVEVFSSTYSVEVVAGSIEKPTNVFKKKEAVQVAQAIGQFAKAAPITSLIISLKVLEKAFTEVVITPEDWQRLTQEAQANIQAQMGGGPTGGPAQPGQGGQASGAGDMRQALMNLPPELKARVVAMKQQGVPDGQILQMIQQEMQSGQATNGQQPPAGGQQQQPEQPGQY